jgi:hypothetical protein
VSLKAIRRIVIGLELFVGVMAIYGGVSLLTDATGFGVREEWLRGSPFANYQIPAIGLLVSVGGSSFLAAGTLLRAPREIGALLSIGAGMVLVAFEIVETYSFGMRNWQQPFMFVVGSLIASLGAMLWTNGNMGTVRRLPHVHLH